MRVQGVSRLLFIMYLTLLSWQLLTPVTIVSAGNWDKLIHFSGFFVLGGLSMVAGWNISAPKLSLILVGYAALTEILQHFIPGRNFSMLDWVADSFGVLAAVLLSLYVLERIPSLKLKTR